MDAVVAIQKMLETGGPWAVAALGIGAYIWERRENKALQKAVMELATAQVQATLKQEVAVTTLKELLMTFISKR